MNFPIALEAYARIDESDELDPKYFIERQVVYNQIEADNFVANYPRSKIITKPLTADELKDPGINDGL